MQARDQIAILLGDALWVILSCLGFSALLLIPDQTLELYRIIYSSSPLDDPQGYLALHLPVVAIALAVWFAAGQVAAVTRYRVAAPSLFFDHAAAALALLMGMLPLAACTWGLIDAVPSFETHLPPTVFWGRMEAHLMDLEFRLYMGAAAQAVLTVLLAAAGWWHAARMRKIADSLNKRHFGQMSGAIAAVAAVVVVVAAIYAEPLALPRLIGAFGIAALFAVCILAVAINFTLLGVRYQFPFIALLCLAVVVFGLGRLNDNHTIRILDEGSGKDALQRADTMTAKDAFAAWLDKRPDRQNYDRDKYPVYVVSAQGGGIYAAYQTAIFLARMQDVCPAFRHHLFAVSSVSGGSIGAAVFAAALDAYDRGLIDIEGDEIRQFAAAPDGPDPCPAITEYRTSDRVPAVSMKPGPLERAVQRALKQDFFAPLLAGALFLDYSQRFLPAPIPAFDRARPLEYALEQAGLDMMKATAAPDVAAAHNALARSILELWSPDRSIPALLINATDAGSGRRFVISPFRTAAAPQGGQQPVTLEYRFWNTDLPATDRARDIRLSTAAFVSARFPWVMPAATVQYRASQWLRLVDGGYVDNSGVDTALDLNGAMAAVLREREGGGDQATRDDERPRPLNLIVLSGGNFPMRKSFSFGDLMEPLRALLSTETSRGYVAIDRARQDFPAYFIIRNYAFSDRKLNVRAGSLKEAHLDNEFYRLPLGWSLSADTRAIIEGQSGRYADCQPDDDFGQAQPGFAQSDCVQLLIYYELGKALTADDSRLRVGAHVAVTNYLAKQENNNRNAEAGDVNYIIACYQDVTNRTVTLEQAGNIRAVIHQWRLHHPHEWNLLPLVLGTAAFESTDFRAREQSLSYMSADQILKSWGRRRQIQTLPMAEVDKLVRQPKILAEMLFGGQSGKENLGNIPGTDDAWNYRPRGLAYVRGRQDYQKVADAMPLPGLMDDPDLMLIPDVSAFSFIYFYFNAGSVPALANAVGNYDWAKAQGTDAQVRNALAIVQRDARRSYGQDKIDDITTAAKVFGTCVAEAPRKAEIRAAAR